MRREVEAEDGTELVRDVELDEGCILCGGALELRISTNGACSYCRACRWISRPQMQRDEQGHVRVIHPAAGVA
jgi:hypothetical protein